jgi:hypothetical protein
VIGLELMMIQSRFYMALGCIVAGVIVAMFPSNYEIVGMEGVEIDSGDEGNND